MAKGGVGGIMNDGNYWQSGNWVVQLYSVQTASNFVYTGGEIEMDHLISCLCCAVLCDYSLYCTGTANATRPW
jgi:hypothetical protein